MVRCLRNNHNSVISVHWLIPLFLILSAPSAYAELETSDASVRDGLQFLSNLTRGSALEGAGSHGSFGTTLGGGTSAHLLPERRELLTSLLGEKTADEALSTPRLWLTKGLPLPIDLGLAMAYANGTIGSSVYGQWTVFEGFRRPALAVRVAEGRLLGARDISLSSTTSEAILSYGILKFLTAYANFGMARHRGQVTLSNQSEFGLLSTQGDHHTEVWQETIRRAGLQLGSPFFTVTAETTLYPDNFRDYAAKIAVLL